MEEESLAMLRSQTAMLAKSESATETAKKKREMTTRRRAKKKKKRSLTSDVSGAPAGVFVAVGASVFPGAVGRAAANEADVGADVVGADDAARAREVVAVADDGAEGEARGPGAVEDEVGERGWGAEGLAGAEGRGDGFVEDGEVAAVPLGHSEEGGLARGRRPVVGVAHVQDVPQGRGARRGEVAATAVVVVAGERRRRRRRDEARVAEFAAVAQEQAFAAVDGAEDRARPQRRAGQRGPVEGRGPVARGHDAHDDAPLEERQRRRERKARVRPGPRRESARQRLGPVVPADDAEVFDGGRRGGERVAAVVARFEEGLGAAVGSQRRADFQQHAAARPARQPPAAVRAAPRHGHHVEPR
mmetsp:Transcript_15698/g.47475  ORF Transcript_15698/g.47475 Transcript_15698/m.47475 type:complete len:360 (-) Transcript_15698:814-1893(-)